MNEIVDPEDPTGKKWINFCEVYSWKDPCMTLLDITPSKLEIISLFKNKNTMK